MEFLGASSRYHMVGGDSGAAGWSGSSFGAQRTGELLRFQGAADLLKLDWAAHSDG